MPKLLVVDDAPAMLLAILRRAFRAAPPEILTATSGGEGVALARQHRPDVTILDIVLPDQSGLDVFRQLREMDARSPVIFITGSSTTDTAIEAGSPGRNSVSVAAAAAGGEAAEKRKLYRVLQRRALASGFETNESVTQTTAPAAVPAAQSVVSSTSSDGLAISWKPASVAATPGGRGTEKPAALRWEL